MEDLILPVLVTGNGSAPHVQYQEGIGSRRLLNKNGFGVYLIDEETFEDVPNP
jgi:hypothetical protein